MPNGIQVDFKYDLFGHRVEKVVSTTTVTTTRYVYSGEAIIGILDGSNNVVSRVIHGPGVDEPLMIRSGTNEAYLYADGLGSIIAVADQNVTLQETVEYQAYGKAIYKDAVSGSTATVSYTGNPYGYTGREPDAETGLYYYRARYYDAEAGRFIQADPIAFQGGDTNLYAYVGNNPVRFVDPHGLLKVYFWFPDSPNIGHVSVELDNGTYISFWADGINNFGLADLYTGVDAPAKWMSALKDDMGLEGSFLHPKLPDATVSISGLDEDAIAKAFADLKASGATYSSKRLCTDVVGDLLRAGGLDIPGTSFFLDKMPNAFYQRLYLALLYRSMLKTK